MSLPTLLGYQRASAFVNATKLASQPLFSSDEEYKISNVLSNTFFIDIDHVSIAIHIVIVLSPSPTVGINAPPENLLFVVFCDFLCPVSVFYTPGVGLTGSSGPSKVLLEFKALILKTEHKQTLQSVAVLDCIERILIGREDISHLG